jgi:Lon protease-like protein
MNTTSNLGIFPLGLVLFPGSVLPLHIFEERYKTLITKCLNNQEQFGINYIDTSTISIIGCSAKVIEVLNKTDDGKMDIVVYGMNRFEINDLSDENNQYPIGEVTFFEDDVTDEPIDKEIFDECIKLYNKIIDVVFNGDAELVIQSHASESVHMSFLMAQKAGLTLPQKQELLEMRNENQRLRYLHKHLTMILPKIEQAETVQKIIANDGYFPS